MIHKTDRPLRAKELRLYPSLNRLNVLVAAALLLTALNLCPIAVAAEEVHYIPPRHQAASTASGRYRPEPVRPDPGYYGHQNQQSYGKLYDSMLGLRTGLSSEISGITYREPGVMQESGYLAGIVGELTYHDRFMTEISAKLAYGTTDYSSDGSGTINDIPNYLFAWRFLGGLDFPLNDNVVATPYVGFGYRRLLDEGGGLLSTRGAAAYDRVANYYYSPLGVALNFRLEQDWLAALSLEYDHFWGGLQETYLSTAGLGFSDIENEQNDGYGVRGAIEIKQYAEEYNLSLKSYVRYWNIDASEREIGYWRGVPWAYFHEPPNDSTEIGLSAGVEF